jgi:hypothetical protein
MVRIGPENLLRPERPDKVAEGEKVHRDPNRRERNARRQKSGKGSHSGDQELPVAADEAGGHAGDQQDKVGEHVDFEA